MNIGRALDTAHTILQAKSPAIMIGLGIGCSVAAVVSAVIATPKAIDALKMAEAEKGESLTKMESFKVGFRYFLPSFAFLMAGAGLTIGAHHIDVTRHGTLLAAYAVTKEELKEHKDGIKEVFGNEGLQKVESKIAEDKLKNHPCDKGSMELGKQPLYPFYDPFSDRYFMSSIQICQLAAANLNKAMYAGADYASLNDYYWEIGIEPTELAREVGWNIATGEIEIAFESKTMDDGQSCNVLCFRNTPYYGFRDANHVKCKAYWEAKSEEYVRGA